LAAWFRAGDAGSNAERNRAKLTYRLAYEMPESHASY
jgi:hypothetical protein